jgi:diguanylate cyclase (GGDEF)-like protein
LSDVLPGPYRRPPRAWFTLPFNCAWSVLAVVGCEAFLSLAGREPAAITAAAVLWNASNILMIGAASGLGQGRRAIDGIRNLLAETGWLYVQIALMAAVLAEGLLHRGSVAVLMALYVVANGSTVKKVMDTAEAKNLADLEARKASERARTDQLTGLHNRGALDEHLAAVAADHGPDLRGVLMIDVDHFKKVNDTLGHDAGDAVLRAVAATIRQTHWPTDFCARYGGEEMCVVLQRVRDLDALRMLGDRIRLAIATTPVDAYPHLSVTASVGAALWRSRDASKSVIARADRALYAAKHAGRNAVRVADDEDAAAAMASVADAVAEAAAHARGPDEEAARDETAPAAPRPEPDGAQEAGPC